MKRDTSRVRLVDFHCHLDLYPDHATAVSQCDREDVCALAVTTTPQAWPRNRDLAGQTRNVRAALGLHPHLVAEREAEIALWETYLPEARYVGEVGLDASPRYYGSFDRQRIVFARILQGCAAFGDKVLTVHSLRAATQVLDMIEAHLPPERGRVVLHWFTGNESEARRAIALGCYFSVNAEMGHNPRGQALLRKLPLERLLTETDGPFTRIQGRPARPADAQAAIEALAQARGTGVDIIATAVWANLSALLRTP